MNYFVCLQENYMDIYTWTCIGKLRNRYGQDRTVDVIMERWNPYIINKKYWFSSITKRLQYNNRCVLRSVLYWPETTESITWTNALQNGCYMCFQCIRDIYYELITRRSNPLISKFSTVYWIHWIWVSARMSPCLHISVMIIQQSNFHPFTFVTKNWNLLTQSKTSNTWKHTYIHWVSIEIIIWKSCWIA